LSSFSARAPAGRPGDQSRAWNVPPPVRLVRLRPARGELRHGGARGQPARPRRNPALASVRQEGERARRPGSGSISDWICRPASRRRATAAQHAHRDLPLLAQRVEVLLLDLESVARPPPRWPGAPRQLLQKRISPKKSAARASPGVISLSRPLDDLHLARGLRNIFWPGSLRRKSTSPPGGAHECKRPSSGSLIGEHRGNRRPACARQRNGKTRSRKFGHFRLDTPT